MVNNSQFNRSVPITKSDTINFDGTVTSATGVYNTTTNTRPIPCEAIFNGGASATITVVYENGQTDQFTVPTGTILPIKAIRVNSTGTAATLLCALYQV